MRHKIKFLIMDVDGTLTDGKIYMGENGEIMKAFNVKDGCGIKDILIPAGIVPVIITARNSVILQNRCNELGIKELFQGCRNKKDVLNSVLERYNKTDRGRETDAHMEYDYSNVAYCGDDILDLPCMEIIKRAEGLIGCPSDAVKKVLSLADFVSKEPGGNGAVREFIEWILEL